MRRHLVELALVLWGASGAALSAQEIIDSYELRYYNAGAPSPVQVEPFAASAVTCNLAPPSPSASTVNPTTAFWDDPANVGRSCRYVAQAGGPIFSIPQGSYEAALVAVNQAGSSPESNRSPFARLDVAGARSGLRLVR